MSIIFIDVLKFKLLIGFDPSQRIVFKVISICLCKETLETTPIGRF